MGRAARTAKGRSMKEYITKDRARQFVCGHCNEVCSEEPCEPRDCDWMAFIDKEPAADVRPVVLCKDCVHGEWEEENRMWECIRCAEIDEHTGVLTGFIEYNNSDHFCAYGERKEGAE